MVGGNYYKVSLRILFCDHVLSSLESSVNELAPGTAPLCQFLLQVISLS